MKIPALYVAPAEDGGEPPRLWGLTAQQRARRLLQGCLGLKRPRIESNGTVALDSHAAMEERLFQALMARPGTALADEAGTVLALHLRESDDPGLTRCLGHTAESCDLGGLELLGPGQLVGDFVKKLRKAEAPRLFDLRRVPVVEAERALYDGAYKGVTDIVTKYVWPWPAYVAVRGLAALKIHPNVVTLIALVLVVAAAWLFLAGHLLAGVICAWLMTLGDTIDGKLARVTLRSSKFGDKLDHLTDLIHPPFWYLAWWWGALTITGQVWHQATGLLAALIVVLAGYVIGRALEIAGKKAAGFNIFIWRPFDAAFRAVVARRNPNLLLMTASLAVGRPDLGLIAVAVWTIISLGIQVAQLVSLRKARAQGERIASFLDAPPAEEAESSRAAAAA